MTDDINRFHRPRLSILVGPAMDHVAQPPLIAALPDLDVEVIDIRSAGEGNARGDDDQFVTVNVDPSAGLAACYNAGLDAATGEWILLLERGETIAPSALEQLHGELAGAGQSGEPRAYELPIIMPAAHGQASPERSWQVRLFPRRNDLRFMRPVRPTLWPAIRAADIAVLALDVAIDRPVIGDRRKSTIELTLKLAQAAAHLDPHDAETQIALAEATAMLGDQRAAGDLFRRAVSLSEHGSSVMLEAYYGLLTTYDARPHERDAQISTCLEALEVFPLDAQLLCGMGNYMLAQNRLDLAIRSFAIAAEHGTTDAHLWHMPDIHEVALACLSLAQQLAGNDDEALATLDRGIEQYSASKRLRRHRLNLLIKQVARDRALAEVDSFPVGDVDRESFRCAVRGGLLAAEKNWTAAIPYLETAYHAGCRDVLCLRWLAIARLSTGQFPAARIVLEEWRLLEPESSEAKAYMAAANRHAGAPAAESESAVRSPSDGISVARPRQFADKHFRIDRETTHAPVPPAPTPDAVPTESPAGRAR